MSVFPIYLYGSDVLRKKAKPVQEFDNSLLKLIVGMTETMRKANGIGLAATQVGDLRRVITIDVSAVEESMREKDEEGDEPPRTNGAEKKTLVLINPELVKEDGSCDMEEGCLSIPDVRAEVTRSESIRVKFRDMNFEEVDMIADKILARVILHEIDHLNGVLFVDHLTKTQRALLNSELRKIKKGEVDTVYPVISALEV
ncbi:MAG: peptide deformylase [Ignavibacteriales bacterium]|nr:peptide deformylase [Ignavibacteriales bacterium]